MKETIAYGIKLKIEDETFAYAKEKCLLLDNELCENILFLYYTFKYNRKNPKETMKKADPVRLAEIIGEELKDEYKKVSTISIGGHIIEMPKRLLIMYQKTSGTEFSGNEAVLLAGALVDIEEASDEELATALYKELCSMIELRMTDAYKKAPMVLPFLV